MFRIVKHCLQGQPKLTVKFQLHTGKLLPQPRVRAFFWPTIFSMVAIGIFVRSNTPSKVIFNAGSKFSARKTPGARGGIPASESAFPGIVLSLDMVVTYSREWESVTRAIPFFLRHQRTHPQHRDATNPDLPCHWRMRMGSDLILQGEVGSRSPAATCVALDEACEYLRGVFKSERQPFPPSFRIVEFRRWPSDHPKISLSSEFLFSAICSKLWRASKMSRHQYYRRQRCHRYQFPTRSHFNRFLLGRVSRAEQDQRCQNPQGRHKNDQSWSFSMRVPS